MNRSPRRLHSRLFFGLSLAIAAILAFGCTTDEKQCELDEDCALDQRCVNGTCEDRLPIGCEGDDDCAMGELCLSGVCTSLADVSGDFDIPMQGCPDGVAPVAGEMVINEIHAAPSNGEDDTNCDGMNSSDDEFIEIVNTTSNTLDITGVELLDADSAIFHTFNGCLAPGRGLVVYNKSLPAMCDATVFGETLGFESDDSNALTNSGERVALQFNGSILDDVTYPSLSNNSSWTRSPDFTGDFVQHDSVTTDRFSVGRCISGAPLEIGCPPPSNSDCGNGVCEIGEDNMSCAMDCVGDCGNGMCDMGEDEATCPSDCGTTMGGCPTGTPPAAGQLRINEVHAAPDSAVDDVNCDGVTESQDEFIELVNDTDGLMDITGVELLENGEVRHTFDGCLAAGSGLVVYNQGLTPMCDLGAVGAVGSSDTFALTNGGGETISISLMGTELDTVTTPNLGSRNSWTRNPDFSGDFTEHGTIAGVTDRFSVGKCVDGSELSRGCMVPMGVCPDGTCDIGEDQVSCPMDCTGACPDGTCGAGEDFGTCAADCQTCGDGNMTCDAGEDSSNCPQDCGAACAAPGIGDLVLNELLFDPAASGGDANCDGNTSTSQDEFVEIVNTSGAAVLLDGVTIERVSSGATYVFSGGTCLMPNQAAVVFGGGTPSCAAFSSHVVETGIPSLLNGGDTINLKDASGTIFTLGTLTWAGNGDATDTSLQRDPELTGTGTAAHDSLAAAAGALQSPATCANGNDFSTGCQ